MDQRALDAGLQAEDDLLRGMLDNDGPQPAPKPKPKSKPVKRKVLHDDVSSDDEPMPKLEPRKKKTAGLEPQPQPVVSDDKENKPLSLRPAAAKLVRRAKRVAKGHKMIVEGNQRSVSLDVTCHGDALVPALSAIFETLAMTTKHSQF